MGVRSQSTGLGSAGESPTDGGYVLEGSLLELSRGTPPPTAELTGLPPERSVTAWRIETGRINGVDVSGQLVLVILIRSREALEGRTVRMILLDERASPEQVLALLDAFQGRLGGPLAELDQGVVEQRGFSQVPIEYQLSEGQAVISVADRLRLVARLDPPGCASEVSVEVTEQGLSWHDDDVPATYREVSISVGPVDPCAPMAAPHEVVISTRRQK
jgi:hypothetical protein